jgi:hypothetical protein
MADNKKIEITIEALATFQANPARFIAERRSDTSTMVSSLLQVCH